MPAKRPWAMFIHRNREFWGCEAYRMVIPANEASAHGYLVDYMHFEDLQRQARQEHALGLVDGVGSYDLYIFPRFSVHDSEGSRILREAGKKLVFEVDDDFSNEHRQVLDEQAYAAIWHFAREIADAITVSTPYLAEVMRRRCQKPVYVLPNSVRWPEWQVAKRERLTIGLTGSRTHEQDWAVLAEVLPPLLARHDVDLEVVGYVPAWARRLQYDYGDRVRLDDTWYSYPDYPGRVGGYHIALCPLAPDDKFNFSKSPIKAIEALASGAAVVATDTNVYRTVLGYGSRGLLVEHTPAAWLAALERLVTDSGLREKLVRKGRGYVRQHHAIDQTWGQWIAAYRAIAKL